MATDSMENIRMPKDLVLIMGTNAQDAESICRIVKEDDFQTVVCSNLDELKSLLTASSCMAAILDIDSVPLDNRTIRTITRSHPGTCFLSTSRKRIHPDLQEAIRNYLFACLHKPINADELQYFLKCIHDNGTESRGPPQRSE